MCSRLVFALAACCAAASCLTAAPLGASGLRVGFLDDQAFRWDASRQANLALAHRAEASVIRVIGEWAKVAPRRPRHAADPFAPAYRLDVLLTICDTPACCSPRTRSSGSRAHAWASAS